MRFCIYIPSFWVFWYIQELTWWCWNLYSWLWSGKVKKQQNSIR